MSPLYHLFKEIIYIHPSSYEVLNEFSLEESSYHTYLSFSKIHSFLIILIATFLIRVILDLILDFFSKNLITWRQLLLSRLFGFGHSTVFFCSWYSHNHWSLNAFSLFSISNYIIFSFSYGFSNWKLIVSLTPHFISFIYY